MVKIVDAECFKKMAYLGGLRLFDDQNAIEMMSEMGNSLERLNNVIDFEMFRPLLEDKLAPKIRKYQGGARAWDYVMMFKVLVLQRLFGLRLHAA